MYRYKFNTGTRRQVETEKMNMLSFATNAAHDMLGTAGGRSKKHIMRAIHRKHPNVNYAN